MKIMSKKQKSRKKSCIFSINTGVFNWQIMVFVGKTSKQIINFIHTKTTSKLDEEETQVINSIRTGINGKSLMLKGNETILWLRTLEQTPQSIGVLAHEAFHLTDFILSKIGITKSDDSDEVWAYMIEHIVREVLKKA